MNFIQNKHVKLDETCLDTKDHLKANLSNVMDVHGCLTSKLHKPKTLTIYGIITHLMTLKPPELRINT